MHTRYVIAPLFALFLLTLVVPLSGQNWWKSGMRGEGPSVRQELDVDDFEEISLNIPAKLYLRQGNRQSVEIEAQQNIIDNVLTEVRNGSWKVKYDRPVRDAREVTVWVTVPYLRGAHISGSGSIQGESMFTGLDDMDVSISGSGDIDMELEASSLSSSISGSGDIVLRGQTGDHDVHISGSGDVEAFDMKAQNVEIHISGSGDVEVHAEGELDIHTSGSGDVVYSGRPRVKAKVSGSGDVEPRS